MARLPTYVNSRTVQTGSQFLRTQRPDTQIGRAVEGLGRDIAVAADFMIKADEKANRFAAEKELISFETRQRQNIDHAKLNELPEDGRGFYKNQMTKVNGDLRDTLGRIDPGLRQEYELKLMKRQQMFGNELGNVEMGARKSFIEKVVTDKTNGLAEQVATGFIDRNSAKTVVSEFITENNFHSELAEKLRKQMNRAIDLSHLDRMAKTQPEKLYQEMAKFRMTGVAKGVEGVPRQIVELSRVYDADPTYMLMVSKLETNFNPNTTASKTIAGPFQMTRANRKRYGVPEHLKFDVAANTAAFAQLTKDNEARLARNGFEVTNASRWGMHFLGAGGYVGMRRANPNASAYEVYRSIAGQRIADMAFSSNGKLLQKGMTVGQVLGGIERLVARRQAEVQHMVVPENPDGAPLENGKIKIGGETLEEVTPADLMRFYSASRKNVAASVERDLTIARKEQLNSEGGFNPYDPAFRRNANKASVDDARRFSEGDDATVTKYMAIARNGFVPKPVALAAANMLQSSNPTQRATAYETLANAHLADRSNGLRFSGVTDDARKRIEYYTALRATTGMSAAEAAEQTTTRYSAEFKDKFRSAKQSADFRQEVAKRDFDELKDQLGIERGQWIFDGDHVDASPLTDVARRQITDLYQQRFAYHMNREDSDVDVSKRKAAADIKGIHGESSLLGKPRFMAYPPERYYPKVGGSHAYIVKQLHNRLSTHLEREYAAVNNDRKRNGLAPLETAEVPIDKVELVATQQSGMDFLNGAPVRYQLYYFSPNTKRMELVPGSITFDPSEPEKDVGVAAEKDAPAQPPAKRAPTADVAAERRRRDLREAASSQELRQTRERFSSPNLRR